MLLPYPISFPYMGFSSAPIPFPYLILIPYMGIVSIFTKYVSLIPIEKTMERQDKQRYVFHMEVNVP